MLNTIAKKKNCTVYFSETEYGKEICIKVINGPASMALNEVLILERIKTLKLKYSLDFIMSFHENDETHIITEYLGTNDLCSINFAHYDMNEIKSIFRKILKAVKELHENGIFHMDLKPDNIMILGKTNIKLIDFGFAGVIEKDHFGNEMPCKRYCGTVGYESPAVEHNFPHLATKSDIWSIGKIFKIILLIKYSNLNNESKEFISFILRRLEKNRPSIINILQHPFIKKN